MKHTSSSLFMKSDHGKYRRYDVGNNDDDYEWIRQRTIEPEFDKLTEKDDARKSEREGHGVTDNQSARDIDMDGIRKGERWCL